MIFIKKIKQRWLLQVTSPDDLTGVFTKARLIVKENEDDPDVDAVHDEEIDISDPAAMDVTFELTTTTATDLDGTYYYEVWAYNTDKTKAVLTDSGTIKYVSSILITL